MTFSAARFGAALAGLALLLGAGHTRASEITIIQYELSGSTRWSGSTFTNPVFSSAAPGPGAVGSTITFRFVPRPASELSVQLLSFVQSYGITLRSVAGAPALTGYNVWSLTAPITGAHLVGNTAFGTGSGIARVDGMEHCFASGADCDALFSIPTFYPSVQLPRGGTAPVLFAGGTIINAPPNVPPGPGWVFNTNLSTVQASRPGGTLLGGRYFLNTTNLVGSEIGRTIQPVPEPRWWAILSIALLGLIAAGVHQRS